MADKYTYPGTDVLKNKFNVRDTLLLHAYEKKYVTYRLAELAEKPVEGNFDFKHLQKIHEHLFQDIYPWAGKTRDVDISRVDEITQQVHGFCPSHNIDGFQWDIFNNLRKENYLKGLDKEQFAHKAAEVIGEINTLHPFREGNGRTQREFMRELAHEAGWELDFDGISKGRMTEASIAAAKFDYRGLEDIIKESLKPREITHSQDKLLEISEAPAIKELSKIPDSKTLFNAYAKEVLSENGQIWSDKTNQLICEKMLRNGVSSRRVKDALQHSPDRVEKPHSFVKKIEQSPEIKRELQSSRGLER